MIKHEVKQLCDFKIREMYTAPILVVDLHDHRWFIPYSEKFPKDLIYKMLSDSELPIAEKVLLLNYLEGAEDV